MFQAVNRNHHIAKSGLMVIMPFVKYMLRVAVISYVMLAKINKPDEHSPCAIMIIREPHIAHWEFLIIPASMIPM